MDPFDIISAVKKTGASLSAIARGQRCSTSAVSHVIHGRCRSRRLAAAIAQTTGLSVSTLWPDIYPPEESPEAHHLEHAV